MWRICFSFLLIGSVLTDPITQARHVVFLIPELECDMYSASCYQFVLVDAGDLSLKHVNTSSVANLQVEAVLEANCNTTG